MDIVSKLQDLSQLLGNSADEILALRMQVDRLQNAETEKAQVIQDSIAHTEVMSSNQLSLALHAARSIEFQKKKLHCEHLLTILDSMLLVNKAFNWNRHGYDVLLSCKTMRAKIKHLSSLLRVETTTAYTDLNKVWDQLTPTCDSCVHELIFLQLEKFQSYLIDLDIELQKEMV